MGQHFRSNPFLILSRINSMNRQKYSEEWVKTKNEIEIQKNRQYGIVYSEIISKAAKNSKN